MNRIAGAGVDLHHADRIQGPDRFQDRCPGAAHRLSVTYAIRPLRLRQKPLSHAGVCDPVRAAEPALTSERSGSHDRAWSAPLDARCSRVSGRIRHRCASTRAAARRAGTMTSVSAAVASPRWRPSCRGMPMRWPTRRSIANACVASARRLPSCLATGSSTTLRGPGSNRQRRRLSPAWAAFPGSSATLVCGSTRRRVPGSPAGLSCRASTKHKRRSAPGKDRPSSTHRR